MGQGVSEFAHVPRVHTDDAGMREQMARRAGGPNEAGDVADAGIAELPPQVVDVGHRGGGAAGRAQGAVDLPQAIGGAAFGAVEERSGGRFGAKRGAGSVAESIDDHQQDAVRLRQRRKPISAESLLEMVNDLLDLARVEAGKTLVRPSRFAVANLFGALRGVLRPLQVNDAVDLIVEDASALPPMHTDEAKVAQILRNFVSNSLKFTERGEVRISARLSASGASVIFAVSDTGIGIAPENSDLIFQEFAQVEGSIQRRFKGSGLGLPLSRGFAELLGGRVWLESAVGKGSTFYAEIPLEYRGSPGETAAPVTAPASSPGGCDFIVIDDEEVSRYLIRQSLGPGINLLEAPDGPSGIDLARRQSPRAILLDLRMPGMNGIEVLRELKADASTRDIPVVIVTSKLLSQEERDILDSQAAAVLSKEVLSQPDGGERIRSAIGYRP